MSLDNVQNILLILSGKGGVGKSSVTTQLALALCLAGHTVGVLDIDLTGPSIPRFLGVEDAKVSQGAGGWVPVRVHVAQELPPAPAPTYRPSAGTAPDAAGPTTGGTEARTGTENGHAPGPATDAPAATRVGALHAVSLGFLLASRGSAVVWRGPKKTAMVRQFLTDVRWPPLDYLLIDTPPGTSDEHISVVERLLAVLPGDGGGVGGEPNGATGAANGVDRSGSAPQTRGPRLGGAVVVTTPQAVAVADVRKELNFCAKTGVRVAGVVENLSGYVCPCCGVETSLFSKGGGQVMAADFGVPFLGAVPVDPLWGRLVEEGRRPEYGKEGDEVAEENGEEAEPPREDNLVGSVPAVDETATAGLLVEKYRSCMLYPVFRDIAAKVAETVERSAAAVVKPPA